VRRIIIFEGPDGAGKTTLAQAVAMELGATYHHHGPYLEVVDGADLATIYRRSFLPAMRGTEDVVLDRCWMSELPYGLAFRNGLDRLGRARVEAIEHTLAYASQARTSVYLCLPTWEVVLKNWQSRRENEFLPDEIRLRMVYDWYTEHSYAGMTSLPVCAIDPFNSENDYVGEITDG
jgi:thymidylate kinase